MCLQSNVAASNAKLALFYDWLFFNPDKDSIMNIGLTHTPAIHTHTDSNTLLVLMSVCVCVFQNQPSW